MSRPPKTMGISMRSGPPEQPIYRIKAASERRLSFVGEVANALLDVW